MSQINHGIMAAIALIYFIFRLQALNFDGYLKFYDYDRELANKYGICLFSETKKYNRFHFIGISLSAAALVVSIIGKPIPVAIFCAVSFVYALIYALKFEKKINQASRNENRCVFLLSHIIASGGKEDYEWKTNPNEADQILNLYHCCKHDKMTMILDLLALLILTLATLIIA